MFTLYDAVLYKYIDVLSGRISGSYSVAHDGPIGPTINCPDLTHIDPIWIVGMHMWDPCGT